LSHVVQHFTGRIEENDKTLTREELKYAEHRTLFMICVCLILFELLPSDFCDMFYCFMYFLFCFCARLGALSGYALWQYLSSDGAGRALRTFDGILGREAGSCLTKGCKGKTMESILFFHIDFCLSAYVGNWNCHTNVCTFVHD
jgi:hypothetical protein